MSHSVQHANENTAIGELIEAGAWAYQQGWVPATGGNFSQRITQGFVITSSGHDKGALSPDMFLQLNASGAVITGAGKPSAETGLHLCIYELVPQANVILHTHSVSSTVLSRVVEADQLLIHGYEMQKSVHGIHSHEQSLEIEIIDNHQDMQVLSQQVSARHAQSPLHYAVLIRGHGVYVWGESMRQARQHLEGLEFLFECELTRMTITGV